VSRVLEGHLIGGGLRFAIVASRFNEFITSKLLGGAEDALTRHGVDMADVDIAWVPKSPWLPGSWPRRDDTMA
jgi:6,7-dimethyl-8-ribityllumazine synthase